LKFDVICDWRFFFKKMFFPHSIFGCLYYLFILWSIFKFFVKFFLSSILSELIVSNLRKFTKFLQHYYITWFLCWLLWLNFNYNRQSTKMSLVKIDQSFATQIWLHLFLLKWKNWLKIVFDMATIWND
jgi:hypothetical protein